MATPVPVELLQLLNESDPFISPEFLLEEARKFGLLDRDKKDMCEHQRELDA